MGNLLQGHVAVVTGGGSGIGEGIAIGYAEQGASVAILDIDVEAGSRVAQTILKKGGEAISLGLDVTDRDSCNDVVSEVKEKLGVASILVNNAGLTRDMLSIRLTDDDWQTVLDVNLTATFRLSRGVLRGMMKRRWGRIVNITSVVGVTGNPGQANYAASKAGLIGMTKSMAQEVASRGITINCLAPGMIVTAMTDVLSDELKGRILGMIPIGRLGESEEIAAGTLFLASDEAAYITGQTLHINGGMAMV